MRWLGSISYGDYLLHMPVIHVVNDVLQAGHWPLGAGFIAATALILLLAHLSQRFFQRPLQIYLVSRFGACPVRTDRP